MTGQPLVPASVAFFSLPLPWIAAELGWIVAEYGRQPWAIDGVLPTFLGVSVTAAGNVLLSLAGFVSFYSALAVVDVYLMARMIRRGPDGLGYWPPQDAWPVGTTAPRSQSEGTAMLDYETLRVIWWLILGVLLIGFAITDGFDLGVGAIFRFVGPHRRGAPRAARIHRAGVGRQPGVVHSRRRRGIRRVAAAVCGLLLRPVSGDVSGAGRVHSAAGGLHLPQQAHAMRAGATCGTGR